MLVRVKQTSLFNSSETYTKKVFVESVPEGRKKREAVGATTFSRMSICQMTIYLKVLVPVL